MSWKYHPSSHTVDNTWLEKAGQCGCETSTGYQPARSISCPTLRERFRAAWAVFTGRADALYWKEQ